VALKKPSELFHNDSDNNKKSIIGNIKTSIERNTNTSEDFSILKEKLDNFSAASNFTETVEEFKNNINQISVLSKEIEQIKEELKGISVKEDLDKSMVTYLVSIESYIDDVQENIKALNAKSINRLKSDFIDLKTQVKGFVENDIPKYDKLLVESELRSSSRIDNAINILEEKLEEIDDYTDKKFEYLKRNLNGINEESLEKIREEVDSLFSYVNKFSKEELPKYKKVFVEGKLKTEEEVKLIENSVNDKIYNFSNHLESLERNLSEENLLFKDNIQSVISSYKDKIDSSVNDFNDITKIYENTLKDIKNREIRIDEKLEIYSKSIENLFEKNEDIIREVNSISERNEKNILKSENNLNKNILDLDNNLNEKIESLQKDILINEQRIIQRNKEYESVKQEIQSIVNKLKIDFIEEQNKKLSKKISHIEDIFEKFNEKTVLSESGSLLTGTENTKTADPLTPLNQEFVTFKDLANHYRTFINRVQIQMAAIGGGGAGFIKDLGDVDITGITTDSILKWNPSNNKWVIGVSGGVGSGGTWSSNSIGIHTTKNVGIGTTTAKSEYALYVQGDGFFTGNVSVAGTVTYEDVTNVDSIGFVTARSGLLVGSATTFTEKLVVEGDARVTGILTIGTASITIDGTNNTITATSFFGDGSNLTGVSTFSGDYNDLTNKPSIPTDTGDLTNNVGFITATSSGSALTGIVTSITAGSGISVDQSTGNVTITATGGGGGGGSWTQIGIQTASSSASIEFNDLNSTYKKYRIEILYVKPATNNVTFLLYFSDNNNSTVFTNNYAWTFDGGASSITTRANGQITVTTVSNTKYGNFTIDLYGMGTNIEPYAKTFGTYFDATPYFRNSDGSIMRNVATTTNAVRIKYSSGNIAEGTFILYGLS